MGLEDKYSDILQNIEAAIAMVYKQKEPTMRDVQVTKALEALEAYYRALSTKREPKEPEIDEVSLTIYETTIKVLDVRRAQGDMKSASEIEKRRFGALKETVFEDVFLACIRKVGKSVKRHTKTHGERGYFRFYHSVCLKLLLIRHL